MAKPQHTDRTWYRLDNAAKIFPAVSGKRNTNVFRLHCELWEEVDPALLQQALDETAGKFPTFQVILRKGLFWYFLERTDQKPVAKKEDFIPCSQIFFRGDKDLLYRVSWYRCRINMDVFHVLSDGGGALDFLRAMVYRYILLKHGGEMEKIPPLGGEKPPSVTIEDAFREHYAEGSGDSLTAKKALQLPGPILPAGSIRILEGEADAGKVVALAKEQGASLTAYLTALLILCIHKRIPKRKKSLPICVKIPIDLRRRFDTETSRNFFSVTDIGFTFTGGEGFAEVLESVTAQLREKTSQEALENRINYTMAMERSVLNRFVPLFIKNPVMRAAYSLADRSGTSAISNMGNVQMPKGFERYIRGFGAMLNPTRTSRVKAALMSYNGRLKITFTSNLDHNKVQKDFFRKLGQEGVEITISCNEEEDYEVL